MFAANLKKARHRANLSQAALAEKLFVTQQTVAKWESGESLPDLENAYALAKLLGVSVDDLIAHNEAATGYPIPPRGKHIFGIVRMGERGQIVIPKKARAILDLHAGSELLILGDEAQGIALQKVEDAESMLESYGRIVNERRADGPTTNS